MIPPLYKWLAIAAALLGLYAWGSHESSRADKAVAAKAALEASYAKAQAQALSDAQALNNAVSTAHSKWAAAEKQARQLQKEKLDAALKLRLDWSLTPVPPVVRDALRAGAGSEADTAAGTAGQLPGPGVSGADKR